MAVTLEPMTTTLDGVRALLLDGCPILIRQVRGTDETGLRALHAGLSERSSYLRFFTLGRATGDAFVDRLVATRSLPGQGALVAELDGRIVGVASYSAAADPTEAEVGMAIADELQHRGAGTLLLEHLVALARSRGVRRFTAVVLPDNTLMLKVFRDTGLSLRMHREEGDVHVDADLSGRDEYLDAVTERERIADTASLRALLRPTSVAVVGASRRADAVGNAVLRNVLAGGFAGPVYPVNRRADAVLGVRAYRSVADLPEAPDLAVVCVPAAAVPAVAAECGRRGVHALVVLSSGLTGDPELESGLRRAVAAHGMRLLGPNCLGVVSLGHDVHLDATFARTLPAAGPVGIVAQSGGVGIALLEQLARLGIGVSAMVSTGDKYDVSSNDLLMWWEGDPATRVAVLYLESFGNPRKFSRLAQRLGTTTPVVAVRSGTSAAAQRAARSHTAATATPAVVRDALFRQAGLVAVDDLTLLLGVVAVLTELPLPAGERIAVVSNAGGAGVLAADACARAGLVLTDLSAATRAAVTALLPPTASIANPVDTTAAVPVETFADCLRAVLADDGVDGVIAISTPTALADHAAAIATVGARALKPLIAVRVDQAAAVDVLRDGDAGARGIPSFADPAVAMDAYARAVRYAEWRRTTPRGQVPDLADLDLPGATAVLRRVLERETAGGWLTPVEVTDLLRCAGIPVVESVVATDARDAAAAAARLGTPVAVKAVVPGLLHKSDRGGVILGVDGEGGARAAYATLRERFGPDLTGVTVQPMVAPGVELLVGVVSDPVFGPLVVLGAGGVATDLLADRAYRLAPVTDTDAAAMVRSLRSSPLLFGFRGAEPADHAAVEDVLLRVGRLAETLPEIAELELNPLVVHDKGCVVVDTRVRVLPRQPADPYLRRLA
jgi:acyl-CoA synthetase (NDP forming)/GNAT superfamily N-acetyltransferase